MDSLVSDLFEDLFVRTCLFSLQSDLQKCSKGFRQKKQTINESEQKNRKQ